MRMHGVVPVTALFVCLVATPAFSLDNKAKVPLSTYRGVYDITLDNSVSNKGVEAATGRMVYEATGSVCEGYTVKVRQVISLQTEDGQHLLDSTSDSYESGDGKTMRFKIESKMDDAAIESTDGEVIIGDDQELQIRLIRPQAKRTSWKGEVLLPTTLSEKIIAAARNGQSTFSARTYDGSAGGETVYDTFTIIGRPLDPSNTKGFEEAALAPELRKMARWPVKISYFKRGGDGNSGEALPDYSMSAELYENGLTRAMRLNFQDFSVQVKLKTLTFLPSATACAK